MKFQNVRSLVTDKDLAAIWDSPLVGGARYPTWYPIFFSEKKPVDHLSNKAVASISGAGGDAWLRVLSPRLCRMDDPEEAAAALAELRAYGALIDAGFDVKPIPIADDSTPDFVVDAGDGPIIIEVFAKHQDESEAALLRDIQDGKTQPGVTRHGSAISITVSEHRPGGAPDPSKPNDSVQANLISRICAAKGTEKQFPSSHPSLLWIDLRSFGVWPEVLNIEQCRPLMSGRDGMTSGALWYAFYGWKSAPIFEKDFPLRERIVSMGHDGRFRLQGTRKSKLSGAILALAEGLVLFENPWAAHFLPDCARRNAERLPWFNLGHSICNWSQDEAKILAEAGRRQIEAMVQWRDRLSFP